MIFFAKKGKKLTNKMSIFVVFPFPEKNIIFFKSLPVWRCLAFFWQKILYRGCFKTNSDFSGNAQIGADNEILENTSNMDILFVYFFPFFWQKNSYRADFKENSVFNFLFFFSIFSFSARINYPKSLGWTLTNSHLVSVCMC